MGTVNVLTLPSRFQTIYMAFLVLSLQCLGEPCVHILLSYIDDFSLTDPDGQRYADLSLLPSAR